MGQDGEGPAREGAGGRVWAPPRLTVFGPVEDFAVRGPGDLPAAPPPPRRQGPGPGGRTHPQVAMDNRKLHR